MVSGERLNTKNAVHLIFRAQNITAFQLEGLPNGFPSGRQYRLNVEIGALVTIFTRFHGLAAIFASS